MSDGSNYYWTGEIPSRLTGNHVNVMRNLSDYGVDIFKCRLLFRERLLVDVYIL